MTDLRINATVTPDRQTSDGNWVAGRGTRDGALFVADWTMALAMEGRAFLLQFGTEDAPINSTTSIDDALVEAVVDVASGTTAIPYYGQGVVGTWQNGTLYNYMIEIDNAKARYTSGGTSFTPLALRTDAPIASTSTAYVGPDVTVSAKSAGGSLEVYRESIEVNVGDAADYWPKMEYKALADAGVPPIVVGAGSVLVHFGAATGDATVYGNLQWFEIPSSMVT
jgi:hypothetical protein